MKSSHRFKIQNENEWWIDIEQNSQLSSGVVVSHAKNVFEAGKLPVFMSVCAISWCLCPTVRRIKGGMTTGWETIRLSPNLSMIDGCQSQHEHSSSSNKKSGVRLKADLTEESIIVWLTSWSPPSSSQIQKTRKPRPDPFRSVCRVQDGNGADLSIRNPNTDQSGRLVGDYRSEVCNLYDQKRHFCEFPPFKIHLFHRVFRLSCLILWILRFSWMLAIHAEQKPDGELSPGPPGCGLSSWPTS